MTGLLTGIQGKPALAAVLDRPPSGTDMDNILTSGRGVVSGSVFPHRIPSFHSRAGHAHQRTGDADTDRGPEGLGEGHHVV